MKRMDKDIRQRVFERDGHTCRYCGSKEGPLHADHVYPYVKGGETSLENMVTSCARCNREKHDKVGVYPLPIGYFNAKPRHSPHITLVTLSGVFTMMMGVLAVKYGYGYEFNFVFLFGVAVSVLSISWNLTRS